MTVRKNRFVPGLAAVTLLAALLLPGCENPVADKKQETERYTITFESHGGSPVAAITGDAGTAVDRPADPEKEGYAFTGWRSAETQGTLYTWPHTLGADVTMHAHWRDTARPPPAQHTITFDSQEGSAVDPVTADAGTQVAKPGNPLREGYAFQGWYDAASGGTEYTDWPHTLTGDVTMYARWQENEPGGNAGDFPAPENLRATVAGNGVELVWDSVPGAVCYEFWYSPDSADSGSARWYEDVEDPVFTMGQLSHGVVWRFWVKAKKADGTTSPFSESAQAVLPVEPPDAASIVVSRDDKALLVAWEPVDGATGYTVYASESYRESNAVPRYTTDNPGVTWATISGLENGKTYSIWIKSKYGEGDLSGFSGRVEGIPGDPGIPGIPVLYAVGQVYGGKTGTDRICVVWDPAANATSYELLYNTVNTTANASTASNIYGTSYLLGGKAAETLIPGATYYLWVRAKAGSKESGLTPSVSVQLGERLPDAFVGTFLSRWPSGGRPYYMDGHRVGPISEMADVFPWNVAGRQSPIGPSPGKYAPVAEPYPLPGIMPLMPERTGITHLSPVSPSGYVLDHEHDQYVFYDGLVMGMAVFGVVRAVMHDFNHHYIAVCEMELTNNRSSVFDFSFSPSSSAEIPPYRAVFGLQRLGLNKPFSSAANIEAGQLNAAMRSFVDGGVAYPAIRLGWRGGGRSGTENLVEEDSSIPCRDIYNPLLIRPEVINVQVNPVLAAAGVSLPADWWTKTTASPDPLDPVIVNAFWNAMVW
jgi:uncharacterized repeat protein (TIGR02543 family)